MGHDVVFNKEEMIEMLELYKNEPYKFEELEKGMWVWDNKDRWNYYIFDTHEEDMAIEVVINDRHTHYRKVVTLCKFEPNRFYPREVK